MPEAAAKRRDQSGKGFSICFLSPVEGGRDAFDDGYLTSKRDYGDMLDPDAHEIREVCG